MSAWTHAICDDCWDARRPDSPSPRAGAGYEEVCCYCGTVTTSGIYYRDDPAEAPCAGEGAVHVEPIA